MIIKYKNQFVLQQLHESIPTQGKGRKERIDRYVTLLAHCCVILTLTTYARFFDLMNVIFRPPMYNTGIFPNSFVFEQSGNITSNYLFACACLFVESVCLSCTKTVFSATFRPRFCFFRDVSPPILFVSRDVSPQFFFFSPGFAPDDKKITLVMTWRWHMTHNKIKFRDKFTRSNVVCTLERKSRVGANNNKTRCDFLPYVQYTMKSSIMASSHAI